jgi:hypothetical protein
MPVSKFRQGLSPKKKKAKKGSLVRVDDEVSFRAPVKKKPMVIKRHSRPRPPGLVVSDEIPRHIIFQDGVDKRQSEADQKAAKKLMAEARKKGPKSLQNLPKITTQPKTKRPANDWVSALKAWNERQNSGSWCIPRKGTIAHAEVRDLMG